MIRKLIISNGHSEREVLLVGNIVVGRDPVCHLSEPDPLLSRRHAEILSSVHGVSVRDLDSRNGVLVNGEKTKEQVLFAGDVVQMGHLHIRYVEEEPRSEEYGRSGLNRRVTDGPPTPLTFDRFREPTPRRWRPEPTPVPDRRRSESSPPRVPNLTPVPRGRAAFEPQRPMVGGKRAGDIPARVPAAGAKVKRDARPAEKLEATVMAEGGDLDAILNAGRPENDQAGTAKAPGDATFAAAVAHLAGYTGEAAAPEPTAGAVLTASADLTVIEASPDCAELLGMSGESLIGDSLTDVFLRGVRRAYGMAGATLALRISRGPNGVIVASLAINRSSETP